jgi:hypothetical protein
MGSDREAELKTYAAQQRLELLREALERALDEAALWRSRYYRQLTELEQIRARGHADTSQRSR